MPAEDRKLVSVRFDDADFYRDLRLLAADRELSMSELIVEALKEWRASQPRFVKAENTPKAEESQAKSPVKGAKKASK